MGDNPAPSRLFGRAVLIAFAGEMLTLVRLSGVIVCLLLATYTSSKIVTMAKIRGWLSGEPPIAKVVSDRAVIEGSYGDDYWLAWDGADIAKPGPNRINLSKEVWSRYAVGDPIEVFYFRSSKWPYHKDGIVASNENFVFDGILLSCWGVGIVVLCIFELRAWRKRKSQRPPKLPTQ